MDKEQASQKLAPIEPWMITDARSVYDVTMRPGGKEVLYLLQTTRPQRTAPKEAERGPFQQLWSLDLTDENAVPRWIFGYSLGPAISNLEISPDGRFFSFETVISPDSDQREVLIVPFDRSHSFRAIRFETSIISYLWSPDCKWIAFVANMPKPPAPDASAPGHNWSLPWTDRQFPRVYVCEIHDGEPVGDARLLRMPAELAVDLWGSMAWTADSKGLIFPVVTDPGANAFDMASRLYYLAIDQEESSKAPIPLLGVEDDGLEIRNGTLSGLAVSPNGKRLAVQSGVDLRDPLNSSLFVGELPEPGGSKELEITTVNLMPGGEFTVSGNPEWLDDHTILMGASCGVRNTILIWDVPEDLQQASCRKSGWPGHLAVSEFCCDAASGTVAASASQATWPSELYVASMNHGDGSSPNGEPIRIARPVQRTDHNKEVLEGVQLPHQETIEWYNELHEDGEDKIKIEGILVYPSNYVPGTKCPLILGAHGGPMISSSNGWASNDWSPVQLFAAHGYAVLWPNYRGSAGRGVAFSELVQDDCGGMEFEDLLAGIDYLAEPDPERPERLVIDKERVGITGWSYGGYLSAWAAAKHSSRFRAVVMGAGVTDWVTMIGVTDIPTSFAYQVWTNFWFQPDGGSKVPGVPPVTAAMLWERSPLKYIDGMDIPMLILQGADDPRVPPEQCRALFHYLRLRKSHVPSELVMYPGEGHGLTQRAHVIDYFQRALKWFDRYLMPEHAAST